MSKIFQKRRPKSKVSEFARLVGKTLVEPARVFCPPSFVHIARLGPKFNFGRIFQLIILGPYFAYCASGRAVKPCWCNADVMLTRRRQLTQPCPSFFRDPFGLGSNRVRKTSKIESLIICSPGRQNLSWARTSVLPAFFRPYRPYGANI